MLDVLQHRLTRDNDVCNSCGGREPGGLYPRSTGGWYCQICLHRIETTQAKLQGYETPTMPAGYLWPGKAHMQPKNDTCAPATQAYPTPPPTRRRR